MAKKFAGENAIKKVMDLGIKLFPNTEITSTEVNTMWNEISNLIVGPENELSKWNYTLNDTNNTVTLNQYTNTTDTDVIVYGAYKKGDKTYKTKITSANFMFSNKKQLQTITFNPGVDSSECTDMAYMFDTCTNLKEIKGIENWDTSKVTTMNSMFNNCIRLTSIDITSWDTSKVTDMAYMFIRCQSLTSLDLTGWDTSKVTNMNSMFYGCSVLTSLDLTSFDISKVTNMNRIFAYSKKLAEIKVSRSKWIISSECDTLEMFNGCGCSAVTYVD